MASFFRSVLLIYFCFWNIFSKAFLWSSEKTALLKIPLRALELDSWVRRGSTLSSPSGEKKIQKALLAVERRIPSDFPRTVSSFSVPWPNYLISELCRLRMFLNLFLVIGSTENLINALWFPLKKSTQAFLPSCACYVWKPTIPGYKVPMQNKQ